MSSPVPGRRGEEHDLFIAYAARLRAIVARQVSTSQANVDDACAFAWVQLLRYQPARETMLSWLCRVAIRQAIRLDRGQQRFTDLDDEIAGALEAPGTVEDRLEILAAGQAVRDAGLRDREADLVALQVVGYSYAQIAAARQISERTVERQLARAAGKLAWARERQGG